MPNKVDKIPVNLKTILCQKYSLHLLKRNLKLITWTTNVSDFNKSTYLLFTFYWQFANGCCLNFQNRRTFCFFRRKLHPHSNRTARADQAGQLRGILYANHIFCVHLDKIEQEPVLMPTQRTNSLQKSCSWGLVNFNCKMPTFFLR